MKFNELPINRSLIEATVKLGFDEATQIQEEVIPQAISGVDIIAQAPTGTGKTCAFGLPILNNIDEFDESVQALILSPTRELALQITNDLRDYSIYMENIRIVTVYGGESIDKQISALKKKPQIIVATPGRLKDHLERKTIRLKKLKTIVLDEADEMLNMGFREDIDDILKEANVEHQTLLFSATFSSEIERICDEYLNNPIRIKIKSKSLTVDTVKQHYIMVKEKDKIEVMSRVIDLNSFVNVMVFCNTKRAVDDVTAGLMQRGYIVEGLHGDMRQMQRDRVMARFRDGLINVLVASDVAARGLDVEGVDAVINYDIPEDEEYYIHRIGRTGRAKKEGLAITLVNTNEKFRLRSVLNYTKAVIDKMEIPDLKQVLKVRIERIINNAINETMQNSISINQNKKMINKIVGQSIIDKSIQAEDIISGLILMQLEQANEVDEIIESPKGSSKSASNARIFINLGKSHKVRSNDLKELISMMADIKREKVKNIDCHDDFSFFEVPKEYLEQVLKAFTNEKYKNKRIIVEEAKAKGSKSSKKTSNNKRSKGNSKNSSSKNKKTRK